MLQYHYQVSDASRVEIAPITEADIPPVAQFLHTAMGSKVPVADWILAMTPSWSPVQPNHGYLLRYRGQVVGAYLALYSERIIDGRRHRFCNLGTWCVAEPHRAIGLRLLRALLRQEGFTFTDLSPNPKIVALNGRLGFAELDTRRAVTLNTPWPLRSKGVQVIDTGTEIGRLISGRDRSIYLDHKAAAAVHHAVIVKGDRSCYVMFRKDYGRIQSRPTFASVLYVGNRDMYRDCARHFYRYLLLRFRLPATLAELRTVKHRPPRSVLMAGPPKMYRSEDLEAEQIDDLYSELTCFGLQSRIHDYDSPVPVPRQARGS